MKNGIKVLVIEDIDEDLKLMERALLKAGVSDIKQVNTEHELTEALNSYRPDVILSDHALPQFNSLTALSLIRQKGISVPFIIVSGNASAEFAAACLKQGADDYILKSNLTKLPSAIESALAKRNDKGDQPRNLIEQRDPEETTVELKKQNQKLETFLYHISHNLRSPLMSMQGLVNLMKQQNVIADPSVPYLDLLSGSIEKLDQTISELLDYVRSSKEGETTSQEIDFQKAVEDQFARMKFMEGAERITATVEVIGDTPFFSDAYRVSVIINNLISNAIKYHDPKKDNPFIKVTIQVFPHAAILDFADNGIGIEDGLLSKVFDMFFRATGNSEGSGLGLYIVKEAVEKLNGKISIQSTLNEGTSLRVVLPNHC